MAIRIALAGNPNCGKTTLFNALTGSRQYVGNRPGVTVEKKEGRYKGRSDVMITDLPGIYSLSPYTPEEVIARNYLTDERPDVILNVIDTSNLERNLYLTAQLAETGIPLVCALNMMDPAEKNGDKICIGRLAEELGCDVFAISAIKGTGVAEAAEAAIRAAESGERTTTRLKFSEMVEDAISSLERTLPADIGSFARRWYAVKLFERDDKVLQKTGVSICDIERYILPVEKALGDDSVSVIANERYSRVTSITEKCVKKHSASLLTLTDRIDGIVADKFLALPIFAAVMFVMYYVSISAVGGKLSELTKAFFIGGQLRHIIESLLNKADVSDMLSGLVLDGIIGGVGTVLGFLPQLIILFAFLSFLEECGYMARVAFILDMLFRRFGLSGKSFIPMLIGTGCGVPAIMSSRTVDNDNDRRITVITATFIPCSAKLPVIAVISGAFFNSSPWVAASAYFAGAAAIVISAVILKKMSIFQGGDSTFIMELPAYHMPSFGSIADAVWESVRSFLVKAGTVVLLSSVLMWFMKGYGFTAKGFGACEFEYSLLSKAGSCLGCLFRPLGWGDGRFTAAALSGLVAKENIAAVFGILSNGSVADEVTANLGAMISPSAAYSFLIFNLLCAPCAAAVGAIRKEMNSTKWTFFALAYQTVLAYICSFIIYQIGSLFDNNVPVNPVGVLSAFILLAWAVYILFSPQDKKSVIKCLSAPLTEKSLAK